MSELRLRRGADSAAVFRRIVVEVDGSVVARLRPQEETIVPVTPGEHLVRARMDWTRSAPMTVELRAGEVFTLESKFGWRVVRDMIIRPRSALDLRRV